MIKVTVFDWKQQDFCHYFHTDILTRDFEKVKRKIEEKMKRNERTTLTKAQQGFAS